MMKNIKNTKKSQKIILIGNPLSTNNIYRSRSMGKFIGVYMSKEGKALKEDYQRQIKAQYNGDIALEGLKLTVELYFGDKRVRDIDNYNKLVLDACSGLLFEDDKQIQELNIKKFYDKGNARIELELSTL